MLAKLSSIMAALAVMLVVSAGWAQEEDEDGDLDRDIPEGSGTAPCMPPSWFSSWYLEFQGENHYGPRSCNTTFINWAKSTFGLHSGDWYSHRGWDDPCNKHKPMGRLLNALWLLSYSDASYASSSSDDSGTALHWAWPFCERIDDLMPECKVGLDYGALTTWSFGNGFHVKLAPNFFWNRTVPSRAAVVLHEARHFGFGGKGHNGGDDCPQQSSCDRRFTDWRANTFEALFLWDFSLHGTRTTSALRDRAALEAQAVLDDGFADPTYLRVAGSTRAGDRYGSAVDGPGPSTGGSPPPDRPDDDGDECPECM